MDTTSENPKGAQINDLREKMRNTPYGGTQWWKHLDEIRKIEKN